MGGTKVFRVAEKVPTIPIDLEPIGEEEGEHHEGEHHEAKPDGEHKAGEHHDDHDDHDKPAAAKDEKPAAPAAKDDHDHDHKLGAPDPHVWLDPDRMVGAVDELAAQLAAIEPAAKDALTQNAAAVKDSLRKLDAVIASRAKAWSKHTIVTFHGSMAYYAKRYGLRIAADILGLPE